MSSIFVTRHPGAVEWAARQGLRIDRLTPHLDPVTVERDDVVIGTLPVHLVAEICARGARYFNLTMTVPAEARGRELSADDLDRFAARLEEFKVEKITC